MKQRTCRAGGCRTILSMYNDGDRCAQHETPGIPRPYVSRRGIMSDAFLGNVELAYRLTPSERRYAQEGG